MALEKFELALLPTMDGGRIKEAFEQALRRCEVDMRDRPNLKKDRSVAIVATLTPVADDHGDLLEVVVQFTVKDSIPARDSTVYHMNAARQGLFFNELSPDDARQLTLDSADGPVPLQRKDIHAG